MPKSNATILKSHIRKAKPGFMSSVEGDECGTPSCIEGWCRKLAFGNLYGRGINNNDTSTPGAEAWLGIAQSIAHRLCFTPPILFSRITPKMACKAIDNAVKGHNDPWDGVKIEGHD